MTDKDEDIIRRKTIEEGRSSKGSSRFHAAWLAAMESCKDDQKFLLRVAKARTDELHEMLYEGLKDVCAVHGIACPAFEWGMRIWYDFEDASVAVVHASYPYGGGACFRVPGRVATYTGEPSLSLLEQLLTESAEGSHV